MAHKLRENHDIQGIQIYDIIALLSQFADDTTIFLSFDSITLNAVIQTLTLIEENTGLKINYYKTSLHRIGSVARSNAKLYTIKNFKWSNDDIEVPYLV